MDFQQFRESISRSQSPRWSPRQKRLNALSRVLAGKQYEHIRHAFSQEREGDPISGKRILLDDRRPATQARLPKELVRDQCGLIFGEDHRPLVVAIKGERDIGTTDWIAAFVHDTQFWLVLMDALWKGSVGSSAIVLRVLGDTHEVDDQDESGQPQTRQEASGPGRYHFEVWPGEECAPIFKRSAPEDLLSLDRRYFVGDDALAAQGYDVAELKATWDRELKGWRAGARNMLGRAGALAVNEWAVRILLSADEETWFRPVPRYVYERPDWTDALWSRDAVRSYPHGIGEVPAQWVRPLPLGADEYFPDGDCLFLDVIDHEYRINRTTSQVGRAFDYAGDPQIARARGKDGALAQSTFGMPVAMGGTASDIIEVDEGGEAKFVEIAGDGLKVAIESYATAMRDFAKTAGAMSRVTPESHTGASQTLSSVAMKMLNASQLILSGILRETAAEKPGGRLIRLAMRLWDELDIDLPSLLQRVTPDQTARLEWQWPRYYEPQGQDKLFEVQSAAMALEAGMISKNTAVVNIGPMFDVTNAGDEKDQIETDTTDQLVSDVTREAEMAKVRAQYAPTTGPKGATPTS